VRSVAELSQFTAKREDLEGLVGNRDALQLRGDVEVERVVVGVEDQSDRLADGRIRLVETARLGSDLAAIDIVRHERPPVAVACGGDLVGGHAHHSSPSLAAAWRTMDRAL
jgi:hypothetical protein